MNKKVWLLLFWIIIGHYSYSQEKVNYTIIDDDPGNYKRTCLNINYFQADVNTTRIGMGFSGRFETKINNFLPWIYYFKDYLPIKNNQNWHAIDDIKKAQMIEFGSGFIIKKKERNNKLPMTYKVITHGNYKTEHYISVPAKTLFIFSLRGGVLINRCLFDFTHGYEGNYEDDFEHKHFTFENTTDGSVNKNLLPIIQTNTSIYSFGMNLRFISNLIIDIEHYGIRKRKRVYDLYFDIMYAPVINIDNFIDENGEIWKIIPDDVSKPQKGGFKLGNTFRIPGFMFNFELGCRPGFNDDIDSNGFYIAAGIGLPITPWN